jgi:hypothetical protein
VEATSLKMGHYTKRLTKVVGALKKASKAHAGQARTLKTILKDQKSYHGGKKKRSQSRNRKKA